MKKILTEADRTHLERQIREAEQQTSAQIVLAIIRRSDSYAEIPWKAFAFAASVSGLCVLIIDLIFPLWITPTTVILTVALILLAAISIALLTVLLPPFARLFLTRNRCETEPLQYAESMFLSHELFATDERRGVLLLVSLFERQVVILPDKGVRDRMKEAIIRNIITDMKPDLQQHKLREAMEKGLMQIANALCPPGFKQTDKNELSDKIIEEDGV